jgi:PPOX class probable F420-dependent enzyme
MATLQDPEVRELLEQPNYAVVSTMSEHGAIRSTIVWVSAEGNEVAVNSAVGRRWPTDLERDPRVTLLVFESGNPYHFVEIRGTATATLEGADEHIDALAKKYLGEDRYPYRTEGEQRVKFVITPEHVRHVRQG